MEGGWEFQQLLALPAHVLLEAKRRFQEADILPTPSSLCQSQL